MAMRMDILRNSLGESAQKMGILMNSLDGLALKMGIQKNYLEEYVALVGVAGSEYSPYLLPKQLRPYERMGHKCPRSHGWLYCSFPRNCFPTVSAARRSRCLETLA